MLKRTIKFSILVIILTLIIPIAASVSGDSHLIQATLLHTNDFHGRLETDYRFRGGSAYISAKANSIRDAVGGENVALIDAGDVYFAAPAISQLLMGESTIDIYNMMGYELAVFGNHEFDKGQEVLAAREAGRKHMYLGTCYGEGALYKTNFEAVEWWTGCDWSTDTKELKRLARQEIKESHH